VENATWQLVTVGAMMTALATGLGAVPLLWMRHVTPRILGLASAVAAGFMLAASTSLAVEGVDRGPLRFVLGAALGVVAIALGSHYFPEEEEEGQGQSHGHSHGHGAIHKHGVVGGRAAVLLVLVMTIHSFAEGVGVGVSYGGGDRFGLAITTAIAVHNIPEGLAISLAMVPRGATVRSAAIWSVISSLPQPIMAIPAFIFVSIFAAVLPSGFGFAAGAMIWVALHMLVEARHVARVGAIVTCTLISGIVMFLFQTVLVTS
jgi:zinc transporter ZupT